MTGANKVAGLAATLLLVFTLTAAPAQAQFGGGGGDMMTQMAPMLEILKAKMGKRRFAKMIQTVGPMMDNGGGGGLGGMMSGGGYGGMLSNAGGQMTTMAPLMVSMAPQMMSMAPKLRRIGHLVGGKIRHRLH